MSTQGERDPLPAGPQNAVLAVTRRILGSRQRIAVLCAVAGVAAGGAWVAAGSYSSDSTSKPSDTVQPAGSSAQTQAEVDRYFPPQHLVEDGAFKAHRTAARQGTDCGEALQTASRDALKNGGCEGYYALSYTRQDGQVFTSATVLRFADEQSAVKAVQLLTTSAGVAFVQPDGVAEPPATVKPLAAAPVAEGRYVTVVASRYADPKPDAKPDDLNEANRAVGYAARIPFVWM